MNETILLEGRPSRLRWLQVSSLLLFLAWLVMYLLNVANVRLHVYPGGDVWTVSILDSIFYGCSIAVPYWIGFLHSLLFTLAMVLGLLSLGHWFTVRRVRIVVTDQRITGGAAWGRRMELPLDQVTSVRPQLGGLCVSSREEDYFFPAIRGSRGLIAALRRICSLAKT